MGGLAKFLPDGGPPSPPQEKNPDSECMHATFAKFEYHQLDESVGTLSNVFPKIIGIVHAMYLNQPLWSRIISLLWCFEESQPKSQLSMVCVLSQIYQHFFWQKKKQKQKSILKQTV